MPIYHVYEHLFKPESKLSPGEAGAMVVHCSHPKGLCSPLLMLPEICSLVTRLFVSWGFLVFPRKDGEHENGSWAITLATPP